MTNPEYTIGFAKYAGRWSAKRQMAVRCPSTTGYKTRAARLICALKGRYSNREGAYIVSEAKARKFEELYNAGYDADIFGHLQAPKAGE